MKKSEASILQIISELQKLYPDAECSLDYKDPFQLLIATILSAQCTDARVNMVTPALFKKFPTPEKMSKASLAELEGLIRTTGFYKNKAKSLKGAALVIASEHHGKLPRTMQELLHLPGVGRKTANVVLGNAFGKPDGIVVDTHVTRLSFRLGLTRQKNAEKIEQDLNKIVPRKNWVEFPHWLILHGRQICNARKPNCSQCTLNSLCPKNGVE